MRSLTLYTLLALSLSACGDSGGAESTSETTNATATGTETAATGTEATTGDTEPGPTSEGPTTSGQTGSESSATTGPTETSATSTGDTTTGDTSTGDTTTGDTSTGDTSTGDTTTGDTTTGDTSTGETEGTTDGTTGGATSDLVIAIVDAELAAFCMPEMQPDPVFGSWYVEFDNTNNASATSATLIKASLSLLDADPPVLEEIKATPKASGPLAAGDYVSVKLEKITGEMHSACDHCDEFYLLELDYQEGDVIHHVTEEVTVPCSF